jgi:transcriptional regulator with GAF, ATPase, and Fis domain
VITSRAVGSPEQFGSTLLIVTDDGLTLRCPAIEVEIVDGPEQGKLIALPRSEVRVGSGPESDLVLADPTVSRHHITLRMTNLGIQVTDAGSRNGTTVDGLRIVDAFARPDSRIIIGKTTLRLRPLPKVVEVPLANTHRFGGLLGKSVAMRRLFALLERIAPTDTTVLIEGETGTGKELVAEAIHEHSRRAAGPFVVFDCSAVSEQLFESELFGHVRGAFTGAVDDRVGAFEAADGGTLFLDEIGELPMSLQPKLLRALERLQVRRVGSQRVHDVDVRVIAATNRSLAREVERGSFREDLYYRLAVVHATSPPLRERADDIPMLIEHLTAQFQRRHPGTPPLPERTIKTFRKMSWPGNVRELRNAVARALSIGPPAATGAGEEPDDATAPAPVIVDLSIPFKESRDQLNARFERAYVEAALAETGGNVSRAAELAGVNRKFIYRVIEQRGLRSK